MGLQKSVDLKNLYIDSNKQCMVVNNVCVNSEIIHSDYPGVKLKVTPPVVFQSVERNGVEVDYVGVKSEVTTPIESQCIKMC